MNVTTHPPGTTSCDWCNKPLAWKWAQFTHDNEALCNDCWPTWLAIIGTPEEEAR